ncbi:MAG: hypothetical protein AAF682_03935 [Planctomycetota bacterium]
MLSKTNLALPALCLLAGGLAAQGSFEEEYDPCEPYWLATDGPDDDCDETKDPTTCLFGQMDASSSADGVQAEADVSGYDGGPLCSVENQSACAGSQSTNYTFVDPCEEYCPTAYVNGLSSGSASVDAEYVYCVGAHSWAVLYGVGEVKCTLWDIMEVCICTLDAAKDSDSDWEYVGTIKIKGVPVPIAVPVVTSSGPVSGSCSQQGAGGENGVSMYTIIYHASILIVGHADGCALDTSIVTGEGDLQNEAVPLNGWNDCVRGDGEGHGGG